MMSGLLRSEQVRHEPVHAAKNESKLIINNILENLEKWHAGRRLRRPSAKRDEPQAGTRMTSAGTLTGSGAEKKTV